MNKIKSTFTIKDLEHLTGIKAHTIRIWEKRYDVLTPLRTDTNIRMYDVHSLQKLLNINTLNSFGYKISNIAKIPQEKLPAMVREILSGKTENNHVISSFKLAMMNLDTWLFNETYSALLATKTFGDIFYDCLLPLVKEIGILWQTGTITPAHEHFISNLIKQKIAVNIDALQLHQPQKTERLFVLYLPEGETYETCLMYINYELLLKGCPTVYLGENISISSLKDITLRYDNITFVSCFTVEPAGEEINRYIEDVKEGILSNSNAELILLGRNSTGLVKDDKDLRVKSFSNIKDYLKSI